MAIFYLDNLNGNDSTTDTPYGWWSVAYTLGNGTEPVADETATGGTSTETAKVTVVVVDSGTWAGGDAAGTLYWYGKSGTFQVETLTFSVGGATCSIGGDFTYCAWKTMTSGATAGRLPAGSNTIRMLKTDDPTLLGSGKLTLTPTQNKTQISATNITGASDNGSGLIRITSTGHGLSTGDAAWVTAVTGTVEANGLWTVTYVDDNNVDLVDSAFVNSYSSGGTIKNFNFASCPLDTQVVKYIDNCDTAWTSANSSTVTTFSPAKENSGQKIAKTSPANSTLYAYKQIPSTDYSSYEKITFWIKVDTVISSEDEWSICLCSDTAGATVQNTFKIPAIPLTATYVALTLSQTGGGALYNGVQSIALYSGSSASTTAGLY